MQLFHIYHHQNIARLVHSDFWLFEFSVWLHVLARSLISIFIPILLLIIGYELGEVVIYYVIYNAIDVPLNFFAQWLIRAIGARSVIIWGTIASIAFFITFFNLTDNNWPLLLVLAFFAALYDALYWVAHLYLFIESTKKSSDAGKSTSILFTVKKFAGILGPAIGAGILIFFSQKVLIVVSIIIFTLSIIPLLKLKIKDRPTEKGLSFREFFKSSREIKNYLSIGLYSIHGSAEGVLWPLFIFISFSSIESVALIPIIVSITAMVFSYFTGRIHKKNREKTIIVGGFLIVLIWILRLILETGLFYYVSIFLVGLFSLLISIPLDSNLFTRGKERDALAASTYRNATSMFMKFVLYGILAIVINIFQVSFILAIVALSGLVIVNYLFLQIRTPDIAYTVNK